MLLITVWGDWHTYLRLLQTNLSDARVRVLGWCLMLGNGGQPERVSELDRQPPKIYMGERMTFVTLPTSKRFRACSPDQDFLLPPSQQDWLPEGHMAAACWMASPQNAEPNPAFGNHLSQKTHSLLQIRHKRARPARTPLNASPEQPHRNNAPFRNKSLQTSCA